MKNKHHLGVHRRRFGGRRVVGGHEIVFVFGACFGRGAFFFFPTQKGIVAQSLICFDTLLLNERILKK